MTGRASQRSRLALLVLLAAARDNGLSRERIVAYLWPNTDPDKGRRLLSDSIYRINQALGADTVSSAGDVVRLDPGRVTSDLNDFTDALASGDLERAVALSSGPFLDGFYIPSSIDFERWMDGERRRIHRERAGALESLAQAENEPAAAARWWRLAATTDPYSSRIALELMRALVEQGERAAAIQHAELHSRLVREDLGLSPDPEIDRLTLELRERPPVSSTEEQASGAAAASVLPADTISQERDAGGSTSVPTGSRRRSWLVAGLAAAALIVGTYRWFVPIGEPRASPSSIIVLPFADLSATGGSPYLADGITEELIDRLGEVEGLRLMGRTTSFAFKDSAIAAADLGAMLNVDAVIEGSVRQAEGNLRISTRLVDASSGFEIWSETLERRNEDVFRLQDDIARAVVERLGGNASGLGRSITAPADPAAFNLYLNGRYEWHRRSEDGLRNAVELFARATQQAPDYARAHVGLADAYAVSGFYDYLSPDEAFPKAREAAHRALALDAGLAEPHATLGYVALYYEWDPESAEAHFRRSIELDPSYSTGHQWHATLLVASSRFEEAEQAMTRAQELDPLSLIAHSALGYVYLNAGEPERALAQVDQTLQMDSTFVVAHLWRGIALEELGRASESLEALRVAVDLSGGSALTRAALARGLALSGARAEARALVSSLEEVNAIGYAPAFEIAKVYDGLGEPDIALQWLRTAYEQRSHSMVFLTTDPQLSGLRSHPEMTQLIADVGFVR